MLGTLQYRLKQAWAVLLGERIAQPKKIKSIFPENDYRKLLPFELKDEEMKAYLSGISMEFCFSEFGAERVNGGGADLSAVSRLEPAFSTLKRYFPEAKYTLYTDFDFQMEGVEIRKVESPIQDKNHPRFFYHTADYFKFQALLNSQADFKCVMDTDVFVYSPEIYSLVYLTEIFGFTAPFNPRNLLKKDMRMSKDAYEITDLSRGNGHSYNQTPMTLWKNHHQGKVFFEKCLEIMLKEPSRASLVMWKSAQETKTSPYLLPQEFCVCDGDEGIGDEIMLHIGHPKVAEYYGIKL